ncbi:hypothetical protein ACA910_007164 [Epithemia clementina (nom. ined.)]
MALSQEEQLKHPHKLIQHSAAVGHTAQAQQGQEHDGVPPLSRSAQQCPQEPLSHVEGSKTHCEGAVNGQAWGRDDGTKYSRGNPDGAVEDSMGVVVGVGVAGANDVVVVRMVGGLDVAVGAVVVLGAPVSTGDVGDGSPSLLVKALLAVVVEDWFHTVAARADRTRTRIATTRTMTTTTIPQRCRDKEQPRNGNFRLSCDCGAGCCSDCGGDQEFTRGRKQDQGLTQ